MGTAEIPLVRMPALCARTGRPADRTVKVNAVKTPPWVWAGLIGGIVVMAILASVAAKRCAVEVPHARGRNVRRSLAAVGLVVTSIAAFTALMLAVFAPGLASATTFLVFGAALGGCVWAYRDAVCSAAWVDDATIELTRLHPAFAMALQRTLDARREAERRAATAGWHPDPSGAYRFRWFDGAAWTQHVA